MYVRNNTRNIEQFGPISIESNIRATFSNKAATMKPAGEKTKTHDSRFRANRARESRPRAVPRTGIVVRERKCRVAFDSTARFELGDLGPTIDLDSYTLPRRYAATSILLLLHLLSTRLSSFRFFPSFDPRTYNRDSTIISYERNDRSFVSSSADPLTRKLTRVTFTRATL